MFRKASTTLFASLVGVFVFAQQPDSERPQPKQPGISIKLVKPGSSPLSHLRYSIAQPKSPIQYLMSVVMGIEILAEGKVVRKVEQPSYSFQFSVKTPNNKSALSELEVIDGQLLPGGNLAPEQRTGALERIQATKGSRYTFEVTERGIPPVAVACHPSTTALPAIAQSLRELLEPFRTLVTPLPSEAVGVGAEWDVEVPLQQNGITTTFKVRYKLLSKTGDQVKIAGSMNLPLDPKSYPVPFPEAFTKEMTSFNLIFSTEVYQDLSLTTPTTADFNINVELKTKIEAEGQLREIVGLTKMNIAWLPISASIPEKSK